MALRSSRRSSRDARRAIRAYGKTVEETIAGLPDALAVLKLHYLRWVLFDIKGDTYFMYQGIFDTDFDKYTEDAVALFSKLASIPSLKILRDFQRIGKRTPRRSSSSSANTSARASSNTVSIPT